MGMVGFAKRSRFRRGARGRIYPPVSPRRDVLTGKKIGATRRIFRSYLQIPPGSRLARLHSRSQFAGTLDADDAFPGTSIIDTLAMRSTIRYRYYTESALHRSCKRNFFSPFSFFRRIISFSLSLKLEVNNEREREREKERGKK